MDWAQIGGGVALILAALIAAAIIRALPERFLSGPLFWREITGSTKTSDFDESHLIVARGMRWIFITVCAVVIAVGLWLVVSAVL